MDDRLKEVQTTDLTDSRVNRDFVDWLKTKGMNYLLLLLLALCAFFAWEWYQQKAVLARDQAWTDLNSATSPAAFRGVAETHATVDAVAELAAIRAADTLMESVRTGLLPGLTAEDPGAAITPEDRTRMLQEADEFYAEALRISGTRAGFAGKPVGMTALFGRAAVAEADGRPEDARGFLTEVGAMATPEYPSLAAQAQARIDNLDLVLAASALPNQADVHVPADTGEAYTPPAAEDLLEFFETESADADGDTGATEGADATDPSPAP